ncbi:hypothetical protein NPIL_18821 [Nephila pilipes]|uniref:Uncharacterized protein n=1 Tax=Nephila pilipes TaxID=299642 RepID=A0A8X6QLC7_NEPPI|nr:hypothetical protein NPIL_18821 [Nephila pilipes]
MASRDSEILVHPIIRRCEESKLVNICGCIAGFSCTIGCCIVFRDLFIYRYIATAAAFGLFGSISFLVGCLFSRRLIKLMQDNTDSSGTERIQGILDDICSYLLQAFRPPESSDELWITDENWIRIGGIPAAQSADDVKSFCSSGHEATSSDEFMYMHFSEARSRKRIDSFKGGCKPARKNEIARIQRIRRNSLPNLVSGTERENNFQRGISASAPEISNKY